MLHRLLLLAVAAGVFAPSAAAQQFDRRSRDEPEIVVEAGGRVGTCDALLFDREGKFLFAGGDDKVVRVWPYLAPTQQSAGGLETDRAKVQILRWRAWREQRGGIKAVALSPDGKRVAVGGYGMKPSTVAVLDRETGDLLALTWPRVRPGESFNTVTAVAFDPDGKRVGFGTADGSVWVWNPDKLREPDRDGRPSSPPLWAGRSDPVMEADGKRATFNFPRLVYFPDAGSFVSVAQSGQVIRTDVAGPLPEFAADQSPARTLLDINDGAKEQNRVYRAILTTDGKWLVFACADRVLLHSTDGKESGRIALPADHFARSIAIDKTGRLAVGVGMALPAVGGEPRFFAEKHDQVWLYDKPLAGGEPKKLPHRGPAEALAFHPTDNRLAIAGGDADEITLLDLATPEKPLTVVRGAGRRPWAVNLTENGKVIGIRTGREESAADPNARGTGDWTRFEIARLLPTLDQTQKWVNPLSTADGWKVVPDEGDRFVWYAVRPGVKLKLGTNRNADQAPTCFTFLPAVGGKPTRLIVGHYYGCSLFELTPERAVKDVLAPTKVFTGHAGEVLSVVAAKDQSWFITGGADHTVAAWSLADWASEPGLGATFAVKGGQVVTTAVDTGSPAYEAGLRTGNVLDFLGVGGVRPPVYDRRPAADREPNEDWGNPGTAEAAVAALKAPRPRNELFFSVAPTAQSPRKTSLTTVRQRPLWKWFPAFDNHDRLTDWVIWMWQGSFYHTKTAHGDRLVGWHVNHPEPGGRPLFYQLQQFEKHFHRLDVIEKLVGTNDVAAALTEALGENPVPVSFTKYEPEPVQLALKQSVAGPQGLGLTVNVRPRGSNLDLLPERVELWVNDHRYKVWPEAGGKPLAKKPFNEPVDIPAGLLRAGDNQLTVMTFNPLGGRAEESRLVSNPRSAGASGLLAFSVGVNDYAAHRLAMVGGPRKGFDNLAGACKDAETLSDRLRIFGGPGRFFSDAKIDLRLDAEATRAKLLKGLDTIAAKAKPDDQLVVFFAGHGDLLLPADGEGRFVFCCPDYSPKNPGGTALSADELFDALAKIKCRKVVLLDACHSGQAADANVLRRFIPAGQGPFVIAACNQGELSYEHPKRGHGVFTLAVLDALGDDFRRADYNSDGELSAEELFDYVSVRVPALMKEIGKPGDAQNPICFPRQPPRFAVVKK